MQLAGSPSWRFSSDVPDSLLVALCIRDLNGLDVPVGGAVPPALAGPLPPARAGRSPAAAAVQWRDWWHALLEARLTSDQRVSGPSGVDPRSWMQRLIAARLAVDDPPEFGSLAGSPELRELIQSDLADANRWVSRRRPALVMDQFDYEIVRSVAEEVARANEVSPDAVRASAQVLPVDGLWWHRVQPGAVLCSISAARDDDTARALLRDGFESGLAV